jgi:Flp pilus assembly protein TadB
MDERPGEGPELPDPLGGGAGGSGAGGVSGPGGDHPADDPKAEEVTAAERALAEEAAEIRRMVEEGAGSQEAIRALAARLREHRAREEELWRTAVKPALVKEGKGRLRGHAKPASPEGAPSEGLSRSAQSVWLGVGMLGLVLVVVVAANTSIWVLLLPVLALLAWAWQQGRDSTSGQ